MYDWTGDRIIGYVSSQFIDTEIISVENQDLCGNDKYKTYKLHTFDELSGRQYISISHSPFIH